MARVEFLAATSLVRPGGKLAVCWRCASKNAPSSLLVRCADNCTIATSSKISLLYICPDSGVGSDCGRGNLYNVIFNSSDICYVFVSIIVITKGLTLFTLLSQSLRINFFIYCRLFVLILVGFFLVFFVRVVSSSLHFGQISPLAFFR